VQNGRIFQRILFPTDGSPSSGFAQDLVTLLAKKLKSEVTVVHVVSHELMTSGMQEYIPETAAYYPHGTQASGEASFFRQIPTPEQRAILSERLTKEVSDIYRQDAEHILSDAIASFKEEGIQAHEKLITDAHVARAILDEAEIGGYDSIVIGHGAEEDKVHLGSVAQKISREAAVPILVARESRPLSRILVPVDGSENGDRALESASFLAKQFDSKMTLLHVQESRFFSLRPELSKSVGTRILADAAKKIDGLQSDQKLESGDPARTITDMASKEDYDIVIMGCTGHNALERFLLGDVSGHVIHYATRNVLLVK
jgi:nucleotide-binding universal stress UspA family protein